jgi:DNA anti-recombination protein RmuC
MTKIHEPNDPINRGIGALLNAGARGNTQEMSLAIAGIIKGLGEFINGGLQRLWDIMMQNGQEVYRIATLAEINRLSSDMILNLLVEKEIISQEELEKRVEKDVKEEFERIQTQAREKAEKLKEELKRKIEEQTAEVEELEEKHKEEKEEAQELEEKVKEKLAQIENEIEEKESDVILASERGKVIKFPAKKEE